MKLITPQNMRIAERLSDESGVSYLQLMKNAGKGFALEIHSLLPDGEILFLCGNGNNGGDGIVAAEILCGMGYSVCVALVCGEPKTEIAKNVHESLKNQGKAQITDDFNIIKQKIKACSVLADCVFGTGFHGEIDGGIAELLNTETNAVKIAADIPSGANGQTGKVSDGCFRADITCTFALEKAGMEQYPAREYCGKIIVIDIGIPDSAVEKVPLIQKICREDVKGIIPERRKDSHKGNFGRLLTITGSGRMPGACAMSTLAALRCGAGLVTAAAPLSVVQSLSSAIYEPVWLPLSADGDGFPLYENIDKILAAAENATAVLIGCGLGVTEDTRKIVHAVIKNVNCPIILDADGINVISDSIDIIKEAKKDILLTPHPGEMARMRKCGTGEIQADRISAAELFACEYGCTILLKGAGTVIASPNMTYINTTGNPGMSRGGSGDVLSGILAAFAAQGIGAEKAAVLGAYIHGAAGDLAAQRLSMQAMLPTDIISELPKLFLDLGL